MERVSGAAVSDALLSAVPGSASVVARDGTVVESLDGDATGFGADGATELEGAALGAVLPSDAADRVADAVGTVLSTGEEESVGYVAPAGAEPNRFEARVIPLDVEDGLVLLTVEDAGSAGEVDADRLRRAVERAPIGVTISGPPSEDLPMRYVNDAFTEITGYDRADSLDRNCRFLQGEGTQDGPVSRLREAVESREAGTTELRNYRADGTEFWNRVTIAPIDDGEDPCFVGFQEDVTADREREAKIRAGEAKYRNLTDRITDAYYALDGEWRVTYWNDVVAERYGKPAPEVVGEVFWEAFPAVVDTEVEATIRSASETGEVTSCETYFEPLEGWVKLQVYPDEDGDGVAVISQDVTDLRDRESKLQDTQRRLELALDGTGTAAWEWDPVADEMTWTGGVERLLGLGTETYRGSFGSFLERIHPEDREEVTRLATTVDVDGTFEVECRIRHEGRDDIWTELRGQVVSDEDGAEHVVGTITDVTDRKEHERKLEESNERLEQFAYVASHDLQEPLRTVSNYVEILAEEYADELDDEAGEFVEVATTGCERMQSMINGLLDYSRVTTRGREFEPVDSEAAVEGIVEDLDLMLGEENGTVEWGDLPTVHADPDQLRQVFQNLVKNALEHGGEDPVDVRIRASDEGAAYHFEVEDDGAGIDPERQDDVFRIFNSGKQYQTSGQAKGIGLAICENIVQRHGGDIWVESTPGEGTTFHFTIEQ